MYFGEFHTTLDDKGRLNVPKELRTLMEANDHDTWFMTRGFDGAVFVFEKDRWEHLREHLQARSMLDPEMLDFRRMFLGSVAKVKRDSQGRLMVPVHLRDFGGFQREAVLLGVEDHLELWSQAGWRDFQQRQADKYKAKAVQLFSSNGAGGQGGAHNDPD